MKLNEILKEANANDSDFARTAYSGELAGKTITEGLKLEKFLGKDKYDEFVIYEGYYELDGIELQVRSWMTHPESMSGPAEYDGIDEEVDAIYEGKFYYSYDSEETTPHYWRYQGPLSVYMNQGTRNDTEFEGVGRSWKEALNDMLKSMYNYAHEETRDIYNG
jgi:hypothetical protein